MEFNEREIAQPRRVTMAGSGFDTHIALKRAEHDRLRALGAAINGAMSPRQVVLWMLKREEDRQRRAANKLGESK